MNLGSATSLFAAACVAAASAAQALPFSERTSFELFAGGNASMPGSFRGQTAPFETVDPPGSTVYTDLKFDDAYKHAYTAGVELDYALNSRLTSFGRFAYSQFDGSSQVIGNFDSPTQDALDPIDARFADTTTREFDVGARYTFAPGARFRPFVGAALGVDHLAATRAAVTNPGGTGTTSVELGRADDVFQQRVETGLQFSPMPNFDLRLTAAASHVNADTRSNDPNLALVGLDNTHGDVRAHWDYPAELGAVWHF